MKKLIQIISVFMCFVLLTSCNGGEKPVIEELRGIAEQALTPIAIEEDANMGEYMYTALSESGEYYLLEYHGNVIAQIDAQGQVPCDWYGQVLIDSKTLEVVDTYSYHMFFSGITGIMHVLERINGDVTENDWGRFTVVDKSEVLEQSS